MSENEAATTTANPADLPLEVEESSESIIELGYPLRLTKTDIVTPKSGTQLNPSEMWALRNTWNFIKRSWIRYALELYVDFYTENHEYINRYRNKKTGKINVLLFSEHAYAVFNFIKEIIDNNLKNWDKSVTYIGQMSRCHVAHNIPVDEIIVLAMALKDFILKKCDGLISPTMINAMDKLFAVVFTEHIKHESANEDYVSFNLDE